MGKIFEAIDEHLEQWIARQPMFFVGSAPLSADGHVNVSPKGPIDTLRILDPLTVAYLDMIGSGAETIAHLRENGRIVIMLCAFEGPPRILRLHGRGEVVEASDPSFEALAERCAFAAPAVPQSRRAIVAVAVDRIADSCGYGVPLMSPRGCARTRTRGPRRSSGSEGPRPCSIISGRRTLAASTGFPRLIVCNEIFR